MLQKNTPPSSPELDDSNNMEFLAEEDIDEVIDLVAESESVSSSNLTTDKTICVFHSHKNAAVFCCTLSKNAELAVTGSEEDKAYIWNTTTGEIIHVCNEHRDSIIFAEFSPKETYLAVGDMSGYIKLWRMSDKVCVWDVDMGDAVWMKWHHNANILLAGSVLGNIHMWQLPEGNYKVFQGYNERAEVSVIFPDGERIAVGYADGIVRVLHLKTGIVSTTIPSKQGHFSIITAIDCHKDNNLLISASIDGKTILSTSHNGKIVCVLQSFEYNEPPEQKNKSNRTDRAISYATNWVETAAFCKDPMFPTAATGTINGELFIWDISRQMLRQKITFDGQTGISKVVWKGNTSIIFTGGLDSIVRCIDAKTGNCLQEYKGHTDHILDLYISENGEKMLTASDDGTARVFNISSVY